MKSLYEELNGSYVKIGNVRIPALVSVDSNYRIGFWGQRHKEYLKENQMLWVQKMNNIANQAKEIVYSEIIYKF